MNLLEFWICESSKLNRNNSVAILGLEGVIVFPSWQVMNGICDDDGLALVEVVEAEMIECGVRYARHLRYLCSRGDWACISQWWHAKKYSPRGLSFGRSVVYFSDCFWNDSLLFIAIYCCILFLLLAPASTMTLSENTVDYSNKKILAPMVPSLAFQKKHSSFTFPFDLIASAFNPLGASRYFADAAAGFRVWRW